MNYHTVKTAMRQSDGRVTKYSTLCALILSCPFSSLLLVWTATMTMTTCNSEYRREHQILARAPRWKWRQPKRIKRMTEPRRRERNVCSATKRCRETLIVYYVSLWSRFSTEKKTKNYKSTHVECWPKMKINSKRDREKKIISEFVLYQFLFISDCFFSFSFVSAFWFMFHIKVQVRWFVSEATLYGVYYCVV